MWTNNVDKDSWGIEKEFGASLLVCQECYDSQVLLK